MERRGRKPLIIFLGLYFLCGVAIGAGPFRDLAALWFGRAGIGVAVIVNVLLPAVAIVLGAIHAKPRIALLGGPLLAVGIVVELMLRLESNPLLWTYRLVQTASHPILVVAAVGYGLLGARAAWVSGLARGQQIAREKPLPAERGEEAVERQGQ